MEEIIQVCLVKQFKLRSRWGHIQNDVLFFFFQTTFLNVNKPPVHHNFYFFGKKNMIFIKPKLREENVSYRLIVYLLKILLPAGIWSCCSQTSFLWQSKYLFLTGSTPSCSVIGGLIGDDWFDCLLNLVHLRIWLTTPFCSRSYMTSHIMAGRSKRKTIYISRYLVCTIISIESNFRHANGFINKSQEITKLGINENTRKQSII